MAEDSTQPPHATRFIETTRGILSYSQLAPLLAERVLRMLENIEDGEFAALPLDESLLLNFHRAICGDLTPDWAGRFRAGEVKVGQHSPPLPHQVPVLARDYFADLNVRLSEADENLLRKRWRLRKAVCFSSIRSPISTVASRACCWPKFSGAKICRPWNLRRQMMLPGKITSAHCKPPTDWTGHLWRNYGRNDWKIHEPPRREIGFHVGMAEQKSKTRPKVAAKAQRKK